MAAPSGTFNPLFLAVAKRIVSIVDRGGANSVDCRLHIFALKMIRIRYFHFRLPL
jgi:hypothetical protein